MDLSSNSNAYVLATGSNTSDSNLVLLTISLINGQITKSVAIPSANLHYDTDNNDIIIDVEYDPPSGTVIVSIQHAWYAIHPSLYLFYLYLYIS